MRLYEIKCNEEQWSIKGSRDEGYIIVDKITFESYSIPGDVIGIEQITDDTFLIHRRTMRDEWQILRYKLQGTKFFEYKHEFNHFSFLTEDIIIFDYTDGCHGAELYCISKNLQINDLNHLISGNTDKHDASYLYNRKITLLYENEDDEYPIYLSVNYRLSNTFHCIEYLQFILDVNSLKPVTPVYSTLRNKYFTLNDSLTLKDLVEEENSYLRIIDNFLAELYNTANTKSTEELLSMIQKTE